MKKIKKEKNITIVSLVFLVPLCLSLLIRSFLGSVTLIPSEEEFVAPIEIQGEAVVLRTASAPLDDHIYNQNEKDIDKIFVFDEGYDEFVGSQISVSPKESMTSSNIKMYLMLDKSNISVYDYDYLDISFSIFTHPIDSLDALNMCFSIISYRDVASSGNIANYSYCGVWRSPEDSRSFYISNKSEKPISDDGVAHDIRYVFEFNHECIEDSRMNIYVDGVLVFDTVNSSEPIFDSSNDNQLYLNQIRFQRLSPKGGDILVSDLNVTGYNLPETGDDSQ